MAPRHVQIDAQPQSIGASRANSPQLRTGSRNRSCGQSAVHSCGHIQLPLRRSNHGKARERDDLLNQILRLVTSDGHPGMVSCCISCIIGHPGDHKLCNPLLSAVVDAALGNIWKTVDVLPDAGNTRPRCWLCRRYVGNELRCTCPRCGRTFCIPCFNIHCFSCCDSQQAVVRSRGLPITTPAVLPCKAKMVRCVGSCRQMWVCHST